MALVTACTVHETGSPAAVPAPPVEIRFDELTAPYVDEYARVRTLDMCALHDVAEAQRITDAVGVSLRFTTGLAACELELARNDPPSSWHIEVGFGQRLAEDWESMELSGTQLKKAPDESSGCDYLVPVLEGVGLKVRGIYGQATSSGPRPNDATVCRTIERYLADTVLPAWQHPPTLAEGRTAPRIPLLGKDPCAALVAGVVDVVGDRGGERTLSMSNPYSCSGERGSAIAGYTVEFDIFSEITDLRGQPMEIGGFTAYPGGGIGAGGCSFQVLVKPDLVFSKTEGTVYHGGIVIGLPSCEETDVAKKVIDDLVRQPDAPAAKPDAQRIGDLR